MIFIRSHLKIVFSPHIGVVSSSWTLNENPNFEIVSRSGFKTFNRVQGQGGVMR